MDGVADTREKQEKYIRTIYKIPHILHPDIHHSSGLINIFYGISHNIINDALNLIWIW